MRETKAKRLCCMTKNLAMFVSEGLLNPEELTVAHGGLRVRASAGLHASRRLIPKRCA